MDQTTRSDKPTVWAELHGCIAGWVTIEHRSLAYRSCWALTKCGPLWSLPRWYALQQVSKRRARKLLTKLLWSQLWCPVICADDGTRNKVPKLHNYSTEWPSVRWPFIRVAFCPVALCPGGLLSGPPFLTCGSSAVNQAVDDPLVVLPDNRHCYCWWLCFMKYVSISGGSLLRIRLEILTHFMKHLTDNFSASSEIVTSSEIASARDKLCIYEYGAGV